MRIAICEDEKTYALMEANQCKYVLEQEPVIDIFEDGLPLLQAMEKGIRYDLVLLDLQLANGDGMDIAKKVRSLDHKIPVIFVTGIESRAVEGYEVDAFDYVVKSQLQHRLPAALKRLQEKLEQGRLQFETRTGEVVWVSYEEILWVESEKRGSSIVTVQETYSLVIPIGKIAARLPRHQFVEGYKSVFVNINNIRRIGEDYIEMRNGRKVPLSRRKRVAVMEQVLAAARKTL